MRLKLGLCIVALCVSFLLTSTTVFADTYYLWSNYSGTYQDADKTASNTDDDLMCWAAAASNILAWTGWGNVSGITAGDEDSMFKYFQDHWSDAGSLASVGWYWWFSGINAAQGALYANAGWSQVEVAGGNFWSAYNFSQYYHEETNDSVALSAIVEYLNAGYGTTLGIYTEVNGKTYGHALTVWGYEYEYVNGSLICKGVYVTDSDDYSGTDALTYYDVVLSNGRYYLEDYTTYNWYIGTVQSLACRVPEPLTIVLLSIGLFALAGFRKR